MPGGGGAVSRTSSCRRSPNDSPAIVNMQIMRCRYSDKDISACVTYKKPNCVDQNSTHHVDKTGATG